jgi:hypothetical protein
MIIPEAAQLKRQRRHRRERVGLPVADSESFKFNLNEECGDSREQHRSCDIPMPGFAG